MMMMFRLGVSVALLLMVIQATEQSTRFSNSCAGRCGDNFSSSHPCQCNDDCMRFGDCCDDYETHCDSTIGEVGEVSDKELLEIGDKLWNADHFRYQDYEILLDLQGDRLFLEIDESKLAHPSYAKFIALLDNYNPVNNEKEPALTSQEEMETQEFLDYVASSDTMALVETLLTTKGKIQRGSMKEVLYDLWFSFYGRSSSLSFADSSGFEHVFVGEKKGSKVNGFHSWVQMYLLEDSGSLQYIGNNAAAEPDLLDSRLKWDGKDKQRASMFVGTTPEFDMAIYTLCMIARPGSVCRTSIQGNRVSIQTYDVSHEAGLQVATAFPSLSN